MESELSDIFRVKLVTKNIVRGSLGTQFMHTRVKKKGDKLHVKWKGYNNSFNSWIDKKDIV